MEGERQQHKQSRSCQFFLDTGMLEISHNNHSANMEISHEQSNEPGGTEHITSSFAATLRKFMSTEVWTATNGYSDSNIIGRGGSSTVYKDVEPPPPQEVDYYQAGPIPALGYNAPNLVAFMKIPAALDSVPLKSLKRSVPTGSSKDVTVTKKQRTRKTRAKSQASPPRSVNILTPVESPPQTPAESSETQGAAGHTDDAADESARGPSPHRISSPPPLIIEQNPQVSQDRAQPNEDPIQQDAKKPNVSYSFSVDEYIIERGEEASSQHKLSAENQARLKEIALLLSNDINSLVLGADQIRDLTDLIDQDMPSTLRTALASAAHLDDYIGKVRRASKNIASRTSLQSEDLVKKQQAKELHSQILADRRSLETLGPELAAKKERKTRLEAELAELNLEIQSCEDKMATLPSSIETAKIKMSSIISENQQIKIKLSKIQGSEDDDQKVLDEVNQIRTEAMNVLNSFLSE